jgi:tRNA threonylcarbamoyladenosine biosynthesis protein TsaE
MKKALKHITNLEQTRQVAYELGLEAKPGTVIAFYGDLGTGKTVMTKEIARALDIAEDITSPTYTLMEEYPGKLPFYHFDLYRIENDAEFDFLCFEEYWEGQGVSVIEWAERAKERLPENTISIHLEYIDENTRSILIEYSDN